MTHDLAKKEIRKGTLMPMAGIVGIVALVAVAYLAPASPAQSVANYPSMVGYQHKDVTLDGAGTATWTYDNAYPAPPSVAYMAQGDGTNPVVCNFTSKTSTAVSIKCFKAAPVTLSLAIVTTGLNLNAFGGSPAGLTVSLEAQ